MGREYIEKRYNIIGLTSIETFSSIKGGMNGNCKDVYFLRVSGANGTFAEDVASMDAVQTARMRSGQGIYNRVGAFPRNIDGDRAACCMECYQKWLDTGREVLYTPRCGESAGVGELLSAACKKVLTIYRSCSPGLNDCMEKNFVVKLLFWLDELAFGYLRGWDPRCSMKFVAQGVVKQQEYFFCYFLTLLGVDVLLLQNEVDIEEKLDALQLSRQVVLGEKKAVALENYDSLKQASGATLSGMGKANSGRVSQGMGKADAGAPSRGMGRADSGRESQEGAQAHRGCAMPRVVLPPRRQKASIGGVDLGDNPKADYLPGENPRAGYRPEENPRTAYLPGENQKAGCVPVGSPAMGSGRVPGRTAPPGKRDLRELNFEELALRASSVVMIAIHDRRGEIIGSGSGIMIGRQGYILTNDHVARGGNYYSVRIENDENMYRTDEIIKYNSLLDLAVIRIDRTLQPLPVYRGRNPLVRGQKVVAIGSPLGLFNSVSDGIISGFRRVKDVDMIQFTAPTSHGSSGGAVLNMYGEVIGVSTAGIDEGQNINLAVGYEFINTFIQGFQ